MTDEFTKNLRTRARVWATEITKQANQNLGGFTGLIVVKSRSDIKNGAVNITSTASSKRKDKPVAIAYEYGSGIHSRLPNKSPKQQGTRGYIRIRPKTRKALAFYWEPLSDFAWNRPGKKFIKQSEDGRKLFRYVDHPGVKALNKGKGYLSPAIAKVRRQIRKEIPAEARKSIIGEIRRKFK